MTRKPDDYYTQLLGPAYETDLFKRTSELDLIRRATENDNNKTMKASESIVITPTRRALLQIAVLKPGDLFVSIWQYVIIRRTDYSIGWNV
jgi:hypothetical protein